jgi:hypothetical protein
MVDIPGRYDRGWWWPQNSRKAHYIIKGESLCGKWMCLGKPLLEDGNHASPDNCAACKRKFFKMQEKKK